MARVVNTRRRSLLTLLLGAAVAASGLPAAAGSSINRASDKAAVEGYDVVAYHLVGRPQRGEARFNAEWQGARWWFASEANREQFLADPERFAPQFGGYCAYAMANDSFANGDPLRWRVVDGKLYLNANIFAQGLWARDIPGHVDKGQGFWPRRRAELEARP